MDEERGVQEIVTNFLLNTCRLRSQCNRAAVEAAVRCVEMSTQHASLEGEETDLIPLTTGSVAEFYIEPMLPHIGDIDVMFYFSTELAIPQGRQPPTQLPAEFHNLVKVCELSDKVRAFTKNSIPGYVYLERRYLLKKCEDEDKYYKDQTYKRNVHYLPIHWNAGGTHKIHGPAIVEIQPGSEITSRDIVRRVRCLMWPPQAADWPKRHRNYGWPDSATVDFIVGNGCDVVPVAHRQWRKHKRTRELQWRLSFSRAEIVLINSWTPVQQIVYHMLRVFMKTEQLTDGDKPGAGTLSNYHIKTLMLWACEVKRRQWWTDDFNLVRICVDMLHDLAARLTAAQCPHYFVNNCNLFDSSHNVKMIRSRLTAISTSWLSSWFVNNYIRECAQLCPYNVSRLFDDTSTTTKLQNAVSAVVNWRLNTSPRDIFRVFDFAHYKVALTVSKLPLTKRSIDCWLTELRKISASLPSYFSSVVFLQVACRTTGGELTDELMDVLAVLVEHSIGLSRYSRQHSSEFLLRKAVNLMKAVDNRDKSCNTLQLIAIELSKAYLYTALCCEYVDINSVYCLANVYLAVLYYTTGQYQAAIDHCTPVMRSQDHSQCSSHVVQGELLPKTDDDIDTVLGLAVFYNHVRMTELNQEHKTGVRMFTTELFAHYLHIKCLSVTKCQQLSDTTDSQSSTREVQSYVKSILHMRQLFIADVILWKFVTGQNFVFQQSNRPTYSIKYLTEMNESNLLELLQKSAVEHLTTFRQIEAREFESVASIVTTEFEALYAYKRGDYQRCLQLSTQNVRTLLNSTNVLNILIFPEFIQLLDDDIVSATALTLFINAECRRHPDYSFISQLTLSLYLMTQCQLKLRHSVTSLAQTVELIKAAHRRHSAECTLSRLVLKMIAHKTAVTMNERIYCYWQPILWHPMSR